MDDGKDSFPTALFVAKKQFSITMELFMEAIFLLTIAPTVELKWMVMRPIDADELKKLRDKYIRGEIKFDDEYDLIDKCPTIDISPIIQKRINKNIQEVKERIPPALYDRVSEELLKDQCCSTWIHCLECLVEMADAWEEINGENLVWVPGHYERKD